MSDYPTAPSYPEQYPPPYPTKEGEAAAMPPPPPPGMYPAGPPPSAATYSGGPPPTTTVITQPNVVYVANNVRFGPVPVQVVCPHCHNNVVTKTSSHSGWLPWLVCGGLCLVGCVLGCCLIPFCIDDLKDVQHTCPNCNHMVGMYRRIN